MPLQPATKRYISAVKEFIKNNPIDWNNLSIEAYRKLCSGYVEQMAPLAKGVVIKETTIPVSDDTTIKAKIFDAAAETSKVKPSLIYIPGGGFIAYLDCHDSACSIIAKKGSCRVILIEPRLAPEVRAPIPVADTCTAIEYIFNNSENFRLFISIIYVPSPLKAEGSTRF